jgi:hypothetical protein
MTCFQLGVRSARALSTKNRGTQTREELLGFGLAREGVQPLGAEGGEERLRGATKTNSMVAGRAGPPPPGWQGERGAWLDSDRAEILPEVRGVKGWVGCRVEAQPL